MKPATIITNLLPDFAVDILVMMRRHKRTHGRFPNLLWPKSFNEKILHRNLFDKNPLFEQFTDKLSVRAYVKLKVGEDILPTLYWSTENPSEIPFDTLPDAFVIKPTHGSGWVRFVNDKAALDQAELIKTCQWWQKQSLYPITRERIYRNLKPAILVEEYINAAAGRAPDDYKFYVFGGRVEMVEILTGRFTQLRSSLFDRNWKKLEVKYSKIPALPEDIQAPQHLDEMIQIAETLGKECAFVRVDLYDSEEKIYFGEITVSPGAGLDAFTPPSYDLYLGSLWHRAG